MAAQLGFSFDSTVCTGCKACQVACKNIKALPLGTIYRYVIEYESGSWTQENGFSIPNDLILYHISMACNHCAAPACVAVCPVGALVKSEENGIVTVDQEICIGCKSCLAACPYEAPRFIEELGVIGKCDLCQDQIAAGKAPACVGICPMRALDFGELTELQSKYGNGDVEIEPLPKDSTGPSLVLIPYPKAPKSNSNTGRVVSLPEELVSNSA